MLLIPKQARCQQPTCSPAGPGPGQAAGPHPTARHPGRRHLLQCRRPAGRCDTASERGGHAWGGHHAPAHCCLGCWWRGLAHSHSCPAACWDQHPARATDTVKPWLRQSCSQYTGHGASSTCFQARTARGPVCCWLGMFSGGGPGVQPASSLAILLHRDRRPPQGVQPWQPAPAWRLPGRAACWWTQCPSPTWGVPCRHTGRHAADLHLHTWTGARQPAVPFERLARHVQTKLQSHPVQSGTLALTYRHPASAESG